MGIFTAFCLVTLQIHCLVSGVFACLCNVFILFPFLFSFFFFKSILLLRVSRWKAIAYVLLNGCVVPKILVTGTWVCWHCSCHHCLVAVCLFLSKRRTTRTCPAFLVGESCMLMLPSKAKAGPNSGPSQPQEEKVSLAIQPWNGAHLQLLFLHASDYLLRLLTHSANIRNNFILFF